MGITVLHLDFWSNHQLKLDLNTRNVLFLYSFILERCPHISNHQLKLDWNTQNVLFLYSFILERCPHISNHQLKLDLNTRNVLSVFIHIREVPTYFKSPVKTRLKYTKCPLSVFIHIREVPTYFKPCLTVSPWLLLKLKKNDFISTRKYIQVSKFQSKFCQPPYEGNDVKWLWHRLCFYTYYEGIFMYSYIYHMYVGLIIIQYCFLFLCMWTLALNTNDFI